MASTTTAGTQRTHSFLDKTKARELRVGVIGLGYVGLPLTLLFSEQECRVTGQAGGRRPQCHPGVSTPITSSAAENLSHWLITRSPDLGSFDRRVL